MEEAGIDMSDHYPKLLTDIPSEIDILITMGCNVNCPLCSGKASRGLGFRGPLRRAN